MYIRSLSILILSILFSLLVTAQNQASPELSSPYDAIYNHLYYLQSDSYDPGMAARSLPGTDVEKKKELAIKLKQILDGKGLFVDLEMVPENVNYLDSITNKSRYVLFISEPDIYVEKQKGKWLYSGRTIQKIPEIHSQVFPFGSNLLMNLFPTAGQKKFLGLSLWQWTGILILIVLTIILHLLFIAIIKLILGLLIKKRGLQVDKRNKLKSVAKPMSMLVLSILWVKLVPALMLPIELSQYVMILLKILTPVFAIVTAYKAIDIMGVYAMQKAATTDTTMDDQLVPLVKKGLKIIVVVSGVILILKNLEFNVTALLAGISIGGLAVALAAQDTVKNLIGSFMIFIDKPFQIGDAITFGGNSGTVEEVGFRSTRIRTFANSVVYVPNGKIADSVLDNLGMRVYRRFSTKIALTYDTPPLLMEKFIDGLREIVIKHPDTRKDAYEVHLNEMGSDALQILFYIFFDVPGWTAELKARHEILMAIINLADELGVRFAFPTQTLHIEEFPEKKLGSPTYEASSEVLDKKVADFLANYEAGVKR